MGELDDSPRRSGPRLAILGAVIDTVPATFPGLRARVDAALDAFLSACREETVADDPRATMPLDEVRRIVAAGGKRLRPAFCYWGYRATGGIDGDAIVRASAALELLHTMALIHDDLMDDATQRRGVPASAPHLAAEAVRLGLRWIPRRSGAPPRSSPGTSPRSSPTGCSSTPGSRPIGSPEPSPGITGCAPRWRRASSSTWRVCDVDPASARRAAVLKGGVYTVEGPILIGAALADASAAAEDALARFGAPLGEAFQLRDDLHDREATHGATPSEVNALVARARAALDAGALAPEGAAALDALARLLEMP